MDFEWSEHAFGELCTITRGASPRPINAFLSKTGMPWIKIADATSSDSRFLEATNECIKMEGVKSSVRVFPGDLILSNSATPGLPKFVMLDACIHDGWMLLRKFKGLDKNYAYWLLLNERKNLVAQGNGSVFTNLKTDILKLHRVRIPDLATQAKIAQILDSIAEKIDLNRRINQTLEAMAQAIFKSWFVDFDPVKAKIAAIEQGEDPLRAAMRVISGKTDAELDQMLREHHDQLAATAALFPEAMEESELGEIPKGWEAGVLADLCHLNPESWSARALPDVVRYVDLANAKGGEVAEVQSLIRKYIPSRARRILRHGDTIVGTVRPGNRSFALIGEDGLTGSTGFAVLRPKASHWLEFVYLAATSEANIERLTHLADGGAYPAVRPEIVVQEDVVLPVKVVAQVFTQNVESLFAKILENRKGVILLAKLRDTLLPKLLSGELPIPDTAVEGENNDV